MGLDNFSRTILKKTDNTDSRRGLENAHSVEEAQEGWHTQNWLVKETGRNSSTIERVVRRYRETNPDWFRPYIAANRRSQEHYAPELVDAVLNHFSQHERAPEGWMTISAVSREMK